SGGRCFTAHSTPGEQREMPSLRRILLVGCVKEKQDGRHPARSLYISDLFAKRRAYAERSGQPWFVISARYGLLHPNTPINAYNEKMDKKSLSAQRTWGIGVAEALQERL